jgi:hypothetical protein
MWKHKPTLKWYIGVRTANNCHPDDGYICSSKIVKPMILQNPSEWTREIIALGTLEEMLLLETEILELLDAKHDSRSFNLHNGDGKFSFTGKTHSYLIREKLSKLGKNISNEKRERLSSLNTGKVLSEETKAKMSLSHTGKRKSPLSDETRQKMSLAKKGKPRKPHSDETKEKMSIARQKRVISEETKQKISSTMKDRFKQHIQNTILDKYSMADTKLNKNNPTLSGKLH